MRNASDPSAHSFTFHRSLIRSALNGRMAVKKPLLRNRKRENRLKYATLELDWKSQAT